MKKSLIALAVLGLSGAALAQSSVTLYGKADAGLGKIELGSSPTGGDATNKTQFISGSTMNAFTSRVGVRGVEDLGGGMKAGYTFETGLDLNNGSATSTEFWARQANMSLSSDWGTLKLGKQYRPSYLANDLYDLTDQANYSVLGYSYTNNVRASSAFAYVSPTFNGLTAAAAFVSKNDTGNDKNVWDVAAMYANGPIAAGVSASKTSHDKTAYQLGGKYDFGSFLLAASYSQAVNGTNDVRRGFGLGGTVKFGALALTLDLTRDTKNAWIANGDKYTNGLLEARYKLSKRTYVYAAYLRADKTNNYGLGIDHNF